MILSTLPQKLYKLLCQSLNTRPKILRYLFIMLIMWNYSHFIVLSVFKVFFFFLVNLNLKNFNGISVHLTLQLEVELQSRIDGTRISIEGVQSMNQFVSFLIQTNIYLIFFLNQQMKKKQSNTYFHINFTTKSRF